MSTCEKSIISRGTSYLNPHQERTHDLPKTHILIGCQKRAQEGPFLFKISLKSPFGVTTPVSCTPRHYICTSPTRENLAGPRSESLPDAESSLGLAQNCIQRAAEARKPRWASLQIAFGAFPTRQNLAGHRSKLLSERSRNAQTSLGIAQKLLSERSRNAKTSLDIAPTCFQKTPEAQKPRWASPRIAPRAILRGRQSVFGVARAF